MKKEFEEVKAVFRYSKDEVEINTMFISWDDVYPTCMPSPSDSTHNSYIYNCLGRSEIIMPYETVKEKIIAAQLKLEKHKKLEVDEQIQEFAEEMGKAISKGRDISEPVGVEKFEDHLHDEWKKIVLSVNEKRPLLGALLSHAHASTWCDKELETLTIEFHFEKDTFYSKQSYEYCGKIIEAVMAAIKDIGMGLISFEFKSDSSFLLILHECH